VEEHESNEWSSFQRVAITVSTVTHYTVRLGLNHCGLPCEQLTTN